MNPINPKKKRLLFCNTGMLDVPNGAFRRSYTLATELAAQGMEVTFLTTLPVKKNRTFPYYRERRDGMNVVAVPGMMPMKIRKFGYDPLAVLLRWMFAVWFRFDVVHGDGHRPAVVIPAMTQRWLYGALYVSEWWDLYGKGGFFDTKRRAWKWTVGRLDNALEQWAVRSADRLIVVSEELRGRAEELRGGMARLQGREAKMTDGDKMSGNFGQKDHLNPILKVWGASDVNGIEFEPDPLRYRSFFGLPEQAVILMASGMGEKELRASKKLLDLIRTMDFEVVFVNIESKRELSDWRAEYVSEGVYQSVRCVDYSEYGKLLSCADAFVLLQEDSLKNRSRWPNCIGDFMAAGRPLICSPVGEVKQFCESFADAVFVWSDEDSTRRGDFEAFLWGILEKLKKQQGIKISDSIRQNATETNGWKQKVGEVMKLYVD